MAKIETLLLHQRGREMNLLISLAGAAGLNKKNLCPITLQNTGSILSDCRLFF
jgi:hypothetical protein